MKSKNSLNDFDLIIFDLDGTIANTLLDITFSVNETLVSFQHPKLNIKDVRTLIGSGVSSLMQKALNSNDKVLISKATKFFIKNYLINFSKKTKLYSGILNLLKKLSLKKLAIVTNKPQKHTNVLLKVFKIDKYFKIVYGGDAFKYKKPHPKPITSILKTLKVNNSKAILIGDGVNDVLAAKAANITCASVGYGYCDKKELLALKPDYFVKTISELSKAF